MTSIRTITTDGEHVSTTEFPDEYAAFEALTTPEQPGHIAQVIHGDLVMAEAPNL